MKIKITIALFIIMFSRFSWADEINLNPVVTDFNTTYSYWKNVASNPKSPVYLIANGAGYKEAMNLVNLKQKVATLFIISKISKNIDERIRAKEGLSAVCYEESISNGLSKLKDCIKGESIEGGAVKVANDWLQYKVSKESWESIAKSCMESSGGNSSLVYRDKWSFFPGVAPHSYSKYANLGKGSSPLKNNVCSEVLSEKAFSKLALFPVEREVLNEKTGSYIGYKVESIVFSQLDNMNKNDLYNATYNDVIVRNCSNVSWLMADREPNKYKKLCLNWKNNGLDDIATFASVVRLPWESVRSNGNVGGYKTRKYSRCPKLWENYNGREKEKIRRVWWHNTEVSSFVYDKTFDTMKDTFKYSPYKYTGEDFIMYCRHSKFGNHHFQLRWDFDIAYKWEKPLLLGKKGLKTGLGVDPEADNFTFEYPVEDYDEHETNTIYKKFSDNLYSFNNKVVDWLTNEIGWNFANSYSCTDQKDSFIAYASHIDSWSGLAIEKIIRTKEKGRPLVVKVPKDSWYIPYKDRNNKYLIKINSCEAN